VTLRLPPLEHLWDKREREREGIYEGKREREKEGGEKRGRGGRKGGEREEKERK
jgi:hypothetical protein